MTGNSVKEGIMPKESVYDMYYGHDNDGVAYGSETKVQVGWSKDHGNVQVSCVAPDGWELRPTPEGNGWFVNLDRAGINGLIRILKKARDQGYGRDE